MKPETLALVEVYEYERGSTTNKILADKIVLRYCNKKFPDPKDFAEHLKKLCQETVKQKGIKAKISVEMPNGSPEMYQLRKKGIIVDRVFIINLFIE